MTPDDIVARGMVAMEVARRAVTALAARDIDVMPLKGVLFRALGMHGSERRYVGDVDLLVRPERLAEAERALRGAGYRWVGAAAHALTLWDDELALHVDLHHRLFPPGWFRMGTESLFERAVPATSSRGMWVMDGYDVYAHLIGHFAIGRHNAADARHVADFGAVVSHFELAPSRCAEHLVACGLRRAARYVLRETAIGSHAAHARAVLARLPRDVVGEGLALTAHAVLGRYPRAWTRGSLPAHLLGETVPGALVALGRTAWRRARPQAADR